MSSEAEIERRVETAKALSRLEEKLDGLVEKVENSIQYQYKLSERVRVLEFFKYGVTAITGFVLAVAGYFKFTGGN
ncbi:MAG: hypothetical protein AB7R40_23360 [Nitrospiraceae bacterium]